MSWALSAGGVEGLGPSASVDLDATTVSLFRFPIMASDDGEASIIGNGRCKYLHVRRRFFLEPS